MGLLDILNSIQGGGASSDPRAQSAQAGMSPMAKALLALLAVYAARNLRRADAPSTQPAQQPRPSGGTSAGPSIGTGGLPGGDLGDLLRGTLGGLLGGAGAGTVLNGGLGGLLKQLQESGQGEVAKSWVGTGPNKQISEGDLADALGANTLNEVSRQSGVDRGDLLSGLSQHLPRFVDQLTPDGRVPSEEETSRMV
jgi:uncharacterized protein YidB (DUF937 family)